MRGFAEREDGSTVELILLDLSYEGCGVETSADLASGEALKLSVMRRGAISARVRWCQDGKAGLVFEAEEARSKEYWPRRLDRTQLIAEVSMRRLGKINYRVRVFDISPAGCKVELVETPRVEEHVLVKFQGLESIEAEVCWVEDNCAGLRFENAIHPAVFEMLLERLH